MKKFIIPVVLLALFSPNLSQAAESKKAPSVPTRIQKSYRMDFGSSWDAEEHILSFGKYNRNVRLSSEMTLSKSFYNAPYYQELIDIHKAAMRIHNKYLDKKYTVKISSRFFYLILRDNQKRLHLFEFRTHRLLFIYPKKSSQIYYILKRERKKWTH